MRFLFVSTDYPEFLRWLYAHDPGLARQPYDVQLRARTESLFGLADFYSSSLRRLGCEAAELHLNNDALQLAWAAEHGVRIRGLRLLKSLGALRACRRAWRYEILRAQIRRYRPDVLVNQDPFEIDERFIQEMRPHIRLAVAQIAAPLARGQRFDAYDLIISAARGFVDTFRRQGLRAELHQFGFEPAILEHLVDRGKQVAVSFVGSLSPGHSARRKLLESLCAVDGVEIWGQCVEALAPDSPLRRQHRGQAWGREMYQILRDSAITVNFHIDIAKDYAGNHRLYEATGVGALLLTDWKPNLADMFEPGQEVVTYRSPEECAELVRYYRTHEPERAAIALAGQQRTLRDHTYLRRMQELVALVQPML